MEFLCHHPCLCRCGVARDNFSPDRPFRPISLLHVSLRPTSIDQHDLSDTRPSDVACLLFSLFTCLPPLFLYTHIPPAVLCVFSASAWRWTLRDYPIPTSRPTTQTNTIMEYLCMCVVPRLLGQLLDPVTERVG